MDIKDLVFWPLIMLTTLTLLLILAVGMYVVHPRRWAETLYAAALREVERRFANLGPWSQSNHISAYRLVGSEPKSVADDDQQVQMLLDAVMVLTNKTGRTQLGAELSAIRIRLETSALKRQLRLVARIPSIQLASYLWVGGKVLNRVSFALYGFIWFLPKTLPFLGQRLQKYSGPMAVFGVVLGILWAGISHALTPKSSFDWLAIVGDITVFFAIAAVVVALLGLYRAFLISRFGEPRKWTLQGVLGGVGFILFLGTIIYLNLSGQLTRWQLEFAHVAQHSDLNDEASEWIGGVIVVAFTIYILRNTYTWIRSRTLRASDRLWTIAVAALLLFVLAFFVFFLFDIPLTNAPWFIGAIGWVLFSLCALAGIASCVEWVQKYRVLKRVGRTVKRKGFRWWALMAWSLTGLMFNAMWPLFSSMSLQTIANPVLYYVVAELYNLLCAAWALALLPGMLVTLLYVRRVSKAYENLRFQLAPQHPDLAIADDA